MRWTDLAERDLGGIYEYLFARSPSGTRAVVSGVLAGTERLRQNPEAGSRAFDVDPAGDVRVLVWRQYRIFYRTHVDEVRILRIWDARRDLTGLVLERTASEG